MGALNCCLLARYFTFVSIFVLVYLKVASAGTEICSMHIKHIEYIRVCVVLQVKYHVFKLK